MGGVFINYRRHPDRNGLAERLRGRLAARFGDAKVFLDVASMHPGERYPNRLRRHLDRADVVIALVHDGWVRDLRDGPDWVQYEIRTAFAEGKRIIPVLLDGAEMPTAADLPKPIREFAHLQAHTGPLDALTDVIAEFTERPVAVRQTPERRWSGPLAMVLAVIAFALPVLLRPPLETAVYVSLFGVAVLATVLLATGTVWLIRKPLNAGERLVHDFHPTRYYLFVGLPTGTIMVSVTVAVVFSSPVRPEARPFLIAIAGVAIMLLVFLVLRQHRDEQDREENWPARLPEPVRAAPVRRELDRLRRKAGSDAPRARWHVRHLENAADVLARDASRGWWAWLTADHPAYLLLYAVWAPATVGLMTSAGLPAMRLWVPAIVLVVTAGIVAATVAATYDRQRWVRQRVADEVHVQVQRILDKR